MLELKVIKNEGKLLTINNGETFYQLTKYCKKKNMRKIELITIKIGSRKRKQKLKV